MTVRNPCGKVVIEQKPGRRAKEAKGEREARTAALGASPQKRTGAVHRTEKAKEGLSLFQLKQVDDTRNCTSLPRGPGVVGCFFFSLFLSLGAYHPSFQISK